MSLDERHHVGETDLFPAFALRSCQLTQSNPLPTPAVHTRRGLISLRIGLIPPRCCNFIPEASLESFQRYAIEFRLRCERMMHAVFSHAVSSKVVSADVWTVSYSSTNNQALLQ